MAQDKDYFDVLEYFGGEAYLKEKFPMMYEAIQRGRERDGKENAISGKDEEKLGIQNVFETNLLPLSQSHGDENGQAILELSSHYNYVQKKAAVIVDTSIVDPSGRSYGGDTYVFQEGFEGSLSDPLKGIIFDKPYNLRGQSAFSAYIVDQSGRPVLDSFQTVQDAIHTYVSAGEKVVDSVALTDPKNQYPDNITQTYIVYGNRNDNYVSYQYKDVPSPTVIDGKKYASVWCPFKITVKLNGFTFSHNEPLSDVDFFVLLESSDPDKYGGGGVAFNNDFSKILTALSENDTVLTIEIPVDWKAKLTIEEMNLVIGAFDFSANFKVNYMIDIGGQKVSRMTPIVASTNVVPTNSSIYVSPVKIRWGCLGKKCLIRTETGMKPVVDLRAGELILAADGSYVRVTNVTTGYEKNMITIQMKEGGDTLQLTEAHGIMTKRGVIPAGDILFEDEILMEDGSYQTPFYLSLDEYEDTVYDIETENHAVFLASGVAVTDKEYCRDKDPKAGQIQKLPPEFVEELKRWSEEKERSEVG